MSHEIWFFIAVGLYGFFLPFWNRPTNPTDQRRLALLEKKVGLLLDKLGIEPDLPNSEVVDFLQEGRKINAVKAYREQTGVGLKDAKDAVDAIEAQMKASNLQ